LYDDPDMDMFRGWALHMFGISKGIAASAGSQPEQKKYAAHAARKPHTASALYVENSLSLSLH
jgi:hypothetical protein